MESTRLCLQLEQDKHWALVNECNPEVLPDSFNGLSGNRGTPAKSINLAGKGAILCFCSKFYCSKKASFCAVLCQWMRENKEKWRYQLVINVVAMANCATFGCFPLSSCQDTTRDLKKKNHFTRCCHRAMAKRELIAPSLHNLPLTSETFDIALSHWQQWTSTSNVRSAVTSSMAQALRSPHSATSPLDPFCSDFESKCASYS